MKTAGLNPAMPPSGPTPMTPTKAWPSPGAWPEDFKLMSGTWVQTGSLRVQTIAALSPLAEDALITGHDRAYVGLLVWPSRAGLRSVAPDAAEETLLSDPRVLAAAKAKLSAYNADATGSSARIGRMMFMAEPPSIDAGEITDKRYINQRTSLDRRADLVEKLYAEPPGKDVIVA